MMKIITVKNQDEGGKVCFNLLKEALNDGAKTLGLATGSSPITFYNELIASDLDFTELSSINLDEYVGLSEEDEQSYHYFMNEHLFNKKPFKENFLPNGLAKNLDEEVKRYDALIKEKGIDFQILGIGRNGHIGFNEPGTNFDSGTHLVDLSQDTIEANSRFFDSIEEVPTQALSMGIASIMSAKKIVLMAYGKDKADAIAKTVNGEISEMVPASVLQNHQDVTFIIDEAAGELL